MSALAWRLAGYASVVAILVGVGIRVGYVWQHGQVVALKTERAAAAQVQAEQRTSLAAVSSRTGPAAEEHQRRIRVRAKAIQKEVARYVPEHRAPGATVIGVPCISYGMLRLHEASVAGVDPASVVLPAGQSDDACSTVTAANYVAAVLGNYAIAQANAQQLEDLQNDIRERASVLNATRSSGN